jgi:DNA-binding response OmpR family regulator
MKTKTIIVVEDNKNLLELFGYSLRSLGWEVALAEGAQDFWEELNHIRPTVILLDIKLLTGSGLDIAKQLRSCSAYRDVPIIAMSGLSTRQEIDACFDAGCTTLLLKPFQLVELQNTLIDLTETLPQQISGAQKSITEPKSRVLQRRDLHP